MFASNLVNRSCPRGVESSGQMAHEEDQKTQIYGLFQWCLHKIHHYVLNLRILFTVLMYSLRLKSGSRLAGSDSWVNSLLAV